TSSVYRDWVEETASVLARSRSNPALSQADGELVAGIEPLFEQILTRWEILGKQYESMPKAFVHGDFVAKNMVVVTESPPPHVLVFDWGEAHWGPTAIDLFDTDLGDYGAALRQLDVEISRPALERSQSLGLLLRLIMAVRWDSARLETAYAEKAISHMESYSHALGALLGRADWLGR
ncbi:MAG: phosphotransferase, partial [Acidimicrobiia bacterium]|nr:phosphotransferase [Acidimicrobiia bacterium]